MSKAKEYRLEEVLHLVCNPIDEFVLFIIISPHRWFANQLISCRWNPTMTPHKYKYHSSCVWVSVWKQRDACSNGLPKLCMLYRFSLSSSLVLSVFCVTVYIDKLRCRCGATSVQNLFHLDPHHIHNQV